MDRFWKDRNEYAKWEFNAIANALVKDSNDEYEITEYNHTDREYEYEIDIKKKTIRCWECNWDTSNDDWKCEKGKEVDLLSLWQKKHKGEEEEQIINVLTDNGFLVSEDDTKTWTVSQSTPAGEDWTMDFNNLEEVKNYAENFDPEEEFGVWMDARRNGTAGVPKPSELWKDQEWKKETLDKVLEELK